jgi:hypothetical protein
MWSYECSTHDSCKRDGSCTYGGGNNVLFCVYDRKGNEHWAIGFYTGYGSVEVRSQEGGIIEFLEPQQEYGGGGQPGTFGGVMCMYCADDEDGYDCANRVMKELYQRVKKEVDEKSGLSTLDKTLFFSSEESYNMKRI